MQASLRAVAILHTGRGGYGHFIDTSFTDVPEVELVAVADPDIDGRDAAQQRTGARRAYADYREMLERERPELALICPQWSDQRKTMILDCIAAGVRGLYCDKPLAPTLAEADEILAACRATSTQLLIAHRSRENPYMHWARDLLASGEVGRLEAIRAHGKCDRRAGGLDLAVLSPHLFDQMRYLAGPAEWVSGYVTQDGRLATPSDAVVHADVGPVAGNRIAAMFGFPDGVTGYFESYPGDRGDEHWFGIELHCTRAIIALRNLPRGEVYRYPHGFWLPAPEAGSWEHIHLPEWDNAPDRRPRDDRDFIRASNRLHALNLVRAIKNNVLAPDSTDIVEAVAIQEMITGIYVSRFRGMHVALPLVDRANPFDEAGDG